jgi:hypothetical protein
MQPTQSIRLPGSVFAGLILFGILQARFYASRMPSVMASHFGFSGSPNGWQALSGFFIMELFVGALAGFLAFVFPRTLSAIPTSLINLPNKEYWLSADRRESTLAYFRVHFAWFGCALLAFVVAVMELTFRANLNTPHHLNNTAFIAALVTFLAFTAVWTIRLMVHCTHGPIVKVREVIRMLEQDGWLLTRTPGSHRQYKTCSETQRGHRFYLERLRQEGEPVASRVRRVRTSNSRKKVPPTPNGGNAKKTPQG